jgi:hypothetical protein
MYWGREVDDTAREECAPVDWEPGGHVLGQHNDKVGRIGMPSRVGHQWQAMVEPPVLK